MARSAFFALLLALVAMMILSSPSTSAQTYPQAASNAAVALEAYLDSRFDEVLSAIAAVKLSCQGQASPSPSSVPQPSPSTSPRPTVALRTVTVGPGQQYTEPADAIPYLAPGFNMTVLAGTYYKPFDIPSSLSGWTITGAGGGKTIFDGRGGVGSGYRLAWGKGFVHTQCPGTLNSIVFQGGGGGDGKADGEAGVYAELFTSPGKLTINKCLFQNNENGIFVPPTGAGLPGKNVSVVVNSCDFLNNGQSKDGSSHDLYVQGDSYAETNCNHYGNPYGNNIKVRSPVMTVSGGFHANTAGSRWIDFPNGGKATVTGGVFTISPSSAGGNIIGYAEENQNNGVTGGMAFTGGSKLYVGRGNSQIMVATGGVVSFDSSVSLTWTSSSASIKVLSGGSVTGLPALAPGSSTIGAEPAVPAHISGN